MNSALTIRRRVLRESGSLLEFCLDVTNATDHDVYVEDIELYSAAGLDDLGLADGRCLLMRTGRHKNDMPAVMELGVMDARMQDALGAMTESGDRQEDGDGRLIVSDHLTLMGHDDSWVVIAFMTGCDQLFSTEIEVDANGAFRRLRSVVEFRMLLRPGQTVTTETLRVENTADPMAAIDRFAQDKAALTPPRPLRRPSVFCTWYYYGLTVSWQDVEVNLARMEQLHLPFDVFQIDEGWEKTLGQWEPNEKFPLGMKAAADRIRSAGYTPGIWTSPFVASAGADVWQAHPEWMLRRRDGSPCIFPMNDTTYCVFDITHPGTLPYFEELYRTLTFDWGYAYHKLDFTRAAVIYEDAAYHDPHITLAQAYRRAVAAIRRGMGNEAYFLMCGGLYDPIIDLVDAQRSGSDVLSMWSSTINKGGKTAPYTIKQSLLRYYMNRWWANDPDALMVRRNEQMERGLRLTYGLLTDDEVRTVTLNQLIGGGIVCCTEPLDKITPDRLHLLRHVLPPLPGWAVPEDLLDGGRFPARVRLTFPGSDAQYLALINWDDEQPLPVQLCPAEWPDCPFGPEEELAVCDFFSGEYHLSVRPGDTVMLPGIPPHSASLIKVEPMRGEPVVVASGGHFAMGLEFTRLQVQQGALCWENRTGYDLEIPYRVYVPAAPGREAQVVSIAVNSYKNPCGSCPI